MSVMKQNAFDKRNPKLLISETGGDDRTRTDYLYVANVSLSRVSYAPKTAAK